VRHTAKRRRVQTVMQELIYVSTKVVAHARRKLLNFASRCPPLPAVARRLWCSSGCMVSGPRRNRLEVAALRAHRPPPGGARNQRGRPHKKCPCLGLGAGLVIELADSG